MNNELIELIFKILEMALSSNSNQQKSVEEKTGQNLGWNIVVLDRGWVVVGDVAKYGNQYYLKNGSHIRKWGTTKGLGELVNGPVDETVLDHFGEMTTNELCVNHMIKVRDSAWNK